MSATPATIHLANVEAISVCFYAIDEDHAIYRITSRLERSVGSTTDHNPPNTNTMTTSSKQFVERNPSIGKGTVDVYHRFNDFKSLATACHAMDKLPQDTWAKTLWSGFKSLHTQPHKRKQRARKKARHKGTQMT